MYNVERRDNQRIITWKYGQGNCGDIMRGNIKEVSWEVWEKHRNQFQSRDSKQDIEYEV